MQISAKVALSITLVVAIVGGVGGYARLEQQRTAQLAAFKATNEDAIELLALAVAPAVADGRHDRVQAVLDNIANFGDRFSPVIQLEVLDRQRRVVAALDPERFNDELSPDQVDHDLALQETRSTFLGNHLEIVVPVRLKHPLGVIRATLSQDHLTAQMNEQRNSTVLISLTTMLLIGLGLHVVHQRLVAARLQRLTKNAAAIGEGKLDTRAEVVGDDEIGALGESFNAMATSIQRFTDDLEHIIEERTEELQEANRRLELLATTDQLTQVHNRRYFEDAARRALEVARRNDRPLCVALVDTDMFKSVNDTFGHPVGDEVLKAVAQVLVLNARKADLVARFGGEE
ncbi:MAG: diguanylate cyclase, partial [Myxococcales bacterium]|nr:diguanylate cyclase [Myxococcales bacterium]